MTRTERIVFLLENYLDVLNGLQDGQGVEDSPLALMCRAWNHPSYRELERLRTAMRSEEPFAYWHLAETYFRCGARRILRCANPDCDAEFPTWTRVAFHKHGRRHVALVPATKRVVSAAVNPGQVTVAVRWMDVRWRGEPFIPDDLMARGEQAA